MSLLLLLLLLLYLLESNLVRGRINQANWGDVKRIEHTHTHTHTYVAIFLIFHSCNTPALL